MILNAPLEQGYLRIINIKKEKKIILTYGSIPHDGDLQFTSS